ncbi:hypothetical protein [Jeotgalibacillus haloalkalitolerans]|uniref:Uncharacterized protein n=1 Tax=Jeotgalibacillus haloalkalitolerans TaxID=3104292 RepID=A0ABU5KK76_9BACL|nr:hypothetical protein [Jeotgalibacillus sp. HH7-29]MDZ5711651.1 hypothetical protein [Jeotgalibacillus sp. HH7-29]
MNELNEYRLKKEGKITPKEVIKNLLEAIDRGEVEEVVFVSKGTDGVIGTGWSEISLLTMIGLLEAGKVMALDELKD